MSRERETSQVRPYGMYAVRVFVVIRSADGLPVGV